LSHDEKCFRRRGSCLAAESRHFERLYEEKKLTFKGRTHLRLPADGGFNHGVAPGQWTKIRKTGVLYLKGTTFLGTPPDRKPHL